MPCKVTERAGPYLEVRISGVMSVADMRQVQALAAAIIAAGDQPRSLVVLDGFQGWSKDPAWDDVSFLTEHGDQIARMAIVGDEEWKDQVFMFTARGLRATLIEYFPPAQIDRARSWVRA